MARINRPNNFDHVMFKDVTGNRREHLRIFCSSCTRFDTLPLTGGADYPQAFAERRWRAKDWRVGKDRRNDTCPDCIALENANRRTLNTPTSVHLSTTKEVVVKDAPTVPVNPAKPTPATRRKILEEIENATLPDLSGYRPGTTDEVIAKRLDVPRAWVTEVRETMFEFGDGIAELTALKGEAKALSEQLNRLSADNDSLSKLLGESIRAHAELRAKVNAIGKKLGI